MKNKTHHNKQSMNDIEKDRLVMIRNFQGRRFINMLDTIVEAQKKFEEKFIDFDNLTIEKREKWTKELIVCCIDELTELLNWTNWKHWKKQKTKVSPLEIRYETIDILHFLISIMLVWDMDAKMIFTMYVTKMRENMRRRDSNY